MRAQPAMSATQEQMPAPSTTPKKKPASISKARAKRLAREAHEARQKQRARITTLLEKNHFFSIIITQHRAVIGELFNAARKAEVLVSYRRGTPWICLADDLEDFLKNHARLHKVTSEELFTEIKNELARPWAKKREPVRHRVWKDKDGSR